MQASSQSGLILQIEEWPAARDRSWARSSGQAGGYYLPRAQRQRAQQRHPAQQQAQAQAQQPAPPPPRQSPRLLARPIAPAERKGTPPIAGARRLRKEPARYASIPVSRAALKPGNVLALRCLALASCIAFFSMIVPRCWKLGLHLWTIFAEHMDAPASGWLWGMAMLAMVGFALQEPVSAEGGLWGRCGHRGRAGHSGAAVSGLLARSSEGDA